MAKIIISLVLAVAVGAAIVGAYFYPQEVKNFGSPVGSTFNTAKIAAVNMSPLTLAATSSSVLNTDSSNRYVESLNADCTGVGTSGGATGAGVATWTITAATTTVANEGSQGNTNTFVGSVATTTPYSLLSSVIATTGTGINYVWAPGSYMTFLFNATNTAACVVGVHYLPS